MFAVEPQSDDPAAAEVTFLRARVIALEAQGEADRRNIETLQLALASSRRIGAAIGIVMAATKSTEQSAFDVLRRASQHGNVKLRAVADDVVTTGALPVDPVPAPRGSAD